MQVYVHKGGKPSGPYGIDQLRQFLDAGQLSPQDHACHDGSNWITLAEVPGLIEEAETDSKRKLAWIGGGALILAAALTTGALFLSADDEPATPPKETAHPKNFVLQASDIVSVYDGDTFKVDLAGIHPVFGDDVSIRVNGIDTPEITGETDEVEALARKARDFVKDKLAAANQIELRNPQRGKYFRILADVYVDGASLAEALKGVGLAKAYDGSGKKPTW